MKRNDKILILFRELESLIATSCSQNYKMHSSFDLHIEKYGKS